MPRFYFNFLNEDDGRDPEGLDLPDSDAAWREAAGAADELFKGISEKFLPGQQWELEVTDEHRTPLYRIRVTAEKM